MPTWTALAVFGSTVAIGLVLGFNFLNGRRNSRNLVAAHVLIGLAGLEVFALLLRGAPNGTQLAPSQLGPAAALLFAAALFSGFVAPLIIKPRPATAGPVLALHATFGTIGFGVLLLWLFNV